MARHAARHGCAYTAVLLVRPDVVFFAPVPWHAPASLAQRAALEAEGVAAALAQAEQAVMSSMLGGALRRAESLRSAKVDDGVGGAAE